MSFTPDSPDWDSRFGPKKNPKESLRDLFGSDKVEFEPIDDDEDDVKTQPAANLETPANDETELIETRNQPRGTTPTRPPKNRPQHSEGKRSHSTRSNRPANTVEPVVASSEPTKPPASHWDFLASSLGLKSDQSTTEKSVGTKHADAAPIQPPLRSAAHEPTKKRQPELPVTVEDESPLHELFVPTGEEFAETPPRVVDDITADEGEDFIEFDVEDLVPNAPKRNGDDRKPRRRRKRRGERPAVESVDDSALAQPAAAEEDQFADTLPEPQDRQVSPRRESRDRGPRRQPEQNRKTEQTAQGNRGRQQRDSSRDPTDNVEPRNDSRRSRGDAASARGDSKAESSSSRGESSGSRSKSRGDSSGSREESRGDSRRTRQESGRTRDDSRSDDSRSNDSRSNDSRSNDSRSNDSRSDDSRRSQGPPARSSRSEPVRPRSESAKPQTKGLSPREADFDDEDDFIEIQDNATNVEKNITTWRQAISVIVEANIESRSKPKSGGNRGKPRNDRDHRRR